jgi:hypothetical protein
VQIEIADDARLSQGFPEAARVPADEARGRWRLGRPTDEAPVDEDGVEAPSLG